MIHFHTTSRHIWTMRSFIRAYAPELGDRVTLTPYDEIDVSAPTPPGVHIFADLERLLGPERALVNAFGDAMAARPESFQVFNRPSTSLGRFDLLARLSDEGVNDFRAFRWGKVPSDTRFPAFLRWENDHGGSLGDPVASTTELHHRASTLSWRRRLTRHHLMVTEMADTLDDDGYYRKYSAMLVGGDLIPRHLHVGRSWQIKYADRIDDHTVAEEQQFLNDFPDEEFVRRVFSLSGLTYGRIDYGRSRGRLQVWEINSNPVVVPRPRKVAAERLPAQRRSAELIAEALAKVANDAPSDAAPVLLSRPMRLRWKAQWLASRGVERYRD